jgi:hypothetical protein
MIVSTLFNLIARQGAVPWRGLVGQSLGKVSPITLGNRQCVARDRAHDPPVEGVTRPDRAVAIYLGSDYPHAARSIETRADGRCKGGALAYDASGIPRGRQVLRTRATPRPPSHSSQKALATAETSGHADKDIVSRCSAMPAMPTCAISSPTALSSLLGRIR